PTAPPPAPVPAPTAPVKIHKEEPVPEDVAEEGDNGPEAADRSPPGTPVVLLEEVERAQKRAQKGQSVPPQETIITALPVSVSSEPAPDPRAVTDPPLNLTMDRSEVLRIPRPASSVLVGNPAHIGVLVDDARTLIVVPRAPGATFLTVLDAAKNIVVQRHVIVAAPGKPYIRVRKTCAGGAEGCEPVKAYYCPGMCHEIEITEAQGGSAGAAPEESQMDTVVLPPELMGGPR
ncbi:MAG: pilus assembly protein N-terminal domain-containing protein, partial [Alphaproteobacteria bacterium]|nr:pilus assembly protein N-terminal domain-containing protein [Alphaproteobacteria bacterium]